MHGHDAKSVSTSARPAAGCSYFLGFDGGGTKTECVLADSSGAVLARSFGGPSNPLRAGFTKAWFALSETADVVLRRQKIRADDITAVCAGLGGASRTGVVNQVTSFLKRSFPAASVKVTTDLEIGLAAAFGDEKGILLVAGTGSAAFGRDADGRTARAGGRGPWFSDEGSAFEIGRAAMRAVTLAEDGRGPATALSNRIFTWNNTTNWDGLLDQASKDADAIFPRTFPLVAQLADRGDVVCCEILAGAANSLASLADAVVRELGWREHDVPIAKLGGVYGRSKYFDGKIDAAITTALPRARFVPIEISPAEAAARMSVKLAEMENHAA
jgi:N-acetylglucosamine kinase-like BadF-type ATPase